MCGILGIIGSEKASWQVFKGLITLQHRGQDGAGILSYCQKNDEYYLHKGKGLAHQVFDETRLDGLRGTMAIGHTRYATIGGDSPQDLQPLLGKKGAKFGMVHNGNITNYYPLRLKIEKSQEKRFESTSDLEVLMHLWWEKFSPLLEEKALFFAQENQASLKKLLKEALAHLLNEAKGGFSSVAMVGKLGLFAFRDPLGIRPLAIGKKKESFNYCLSSETGAFDLLGHDYLRDLRPGELVFFPHNGPMLEVALPSVQEEQKSSLKASRPCMFEWVYFSAPENKMGPQNVYSVRKKLGQALAKKISPFLGKKGWRPDIVVPVPETSRPAAQELALKMGLPYRDILMKNRYIQRSFILARQEMRDAAVELKLMPIASEVKGRSLLLVDDSLVRGTTSKRIIKMLKAFGAKDVTLALTCPELRYPCFYGIDFPDEKELLANQLPEEGEGDEQSLGGKNSLDALLGHKKMARALGAKAAFFLSEEDLSEAIGKKSLCAACINGQYPLSMDETYMDFTRERKKMRAIGLQKAF